MKLKHRLFITLTAVTASTLLASFAVVSVLVHRDETRDLDHEIFVQAKAEAELVLLRNPEHPRVLDGSSVVPEAPSLTARYEAVYGREGHVISFTRSFGDDVPAFASLAVSNTVPVEGAVVNLSASGTALRGIVLPLGQGMALLYAVSSRSVDKDMSFLFRVFTVIFLGATLITSLVARWLGALLSRDVDAVAEIAKRVARGDFSARFTGVARGSTETRDLSSDLDHMLVQLNALMAAQRTFISYAAHELRSPLATLRGELQLALRRPRESQGYRETIQESLSEVKLLSALAEDLLTLARVQGNVSVRGVSLASDVVSDALRMARGNAGARHVILREPEEPLSGIYLRGARADLSRAFRNLIDNAIAHSPSTGQVTLSVEVREGRVVLAVEDEGEGVSAHDAPHIFAPFYRASKDQSGDTRGAGLGLAIAREIARTHGGDVTLDTHYIRGARFILELLCEEPPSDRRRSSTFPKHPQGGGPLQGPARPLHSRWSLSLSSLQRPALRCISKG